MKLLSSLLLAALALPAAAQSGVLAGHPAGLHHVALSNPAQFACAPGTGQTICVELNLDADGRNDVSLVYAQVSTGSGGGVSYYEVRALRPEVELAAADSATWMGQRSHALPLAAGDDVNTPPRPVGRYTSWRRGTAATPTKVGISFSQVSPGMPSRRSGYWRDGTSRAYVGVRIGTAASGYRYGWMLVAGLARVEAYAMQTVVSAARPADQAGLRLYPNPATRELRLDLPGATAARVAVCDLTGRVLRRQAVESPRSAVIELGGLAAGIYLVQVATPAGTTTHRISKQ